jgi:hypothetical protein
MVSEIEGELLQAPSLTNLVKNLTGCQTAERENHLEIVEDSFRSSID